MRKLSPEDLRQLQERRRSSAAGVHRNRSEKRKSKRTEIEREERESER